MSIECPHCSYQTNKQSSQSYDCFITFTCSVSNDDHRVIEFEKSIYNDLYKAVIKKAHEIWTPSFQWQFTDHSPKHSARVLKLGEKLMYPLQDTEDKLKPEEMLLFALSAYLHDSAMQRPDEETRKKIEQIQEIDETPLEDLNKLYEEIRKLHAKRIPEVVVDLLNEILSGNSSLRDLARNICPSIKYICRCHSGKFEELKDIEIPCCNISGTQISKERIKMLAGILRFSDELDLSSERVYNRANLSNLPLGVLSSLHWLKHTLVKSLDISDSQKITIEFSHPPLPEHEDGRRGDLFLYQQIAYWIKSKLRTEWDFIIKKMNMLQEGSHNRINLSLPDPALYDEHLEEDRFYEPFNPFKDEKNKSKLQNILVKEIEKIKKPIVIQINIYEAMKDLGVNEYLLGNYSFSEKILFALLEKSPNDIQILSILAKLTYLNKNYEKSIQLFEILNSLKPGVYEIIWNMLLLYIQLGRKDKVLEFSRKLLQIKPDDYITLHNIGCAYRNLEEIKKSIKYFEKALKVNPNAYGTFNDLGSIYKKAGNLKKAIDCYKKAININSDYLIAYHNLAALYAEIEEFEKATSLCNKALEVNPNSDNTYKTLGYIYSKWKKFIEAIIFCNKALELNPNSYEVYKIIGFAYRELEKSEQAIEYLRKYLEINPISEEVLHNLVLTLINLKKYDEAMKYCEKVLKINPNMPEIYNTLGSIYFKISPLQKAIEYFEKALKLNPNLVEAYINLGNAYGRLGKYKDSIKYYNNALKVKPDDYETLKNIGIAYFQMKSFKKAINSFNKALKLKADSYKILCNIAYSYLKTKEYTKAIEFYKKALIVKNNGHEALYDLACTYTLTGERKENLKYLKKAIEIKEDYKKLALTDNDFKDIRQLLEFQKIVGTKKSISDKEIIFVVEEKPGFGYTARAIDESIFTEGNTLDEIRKNIKDALKCYFDKEEDIPDIIRLYIGREEILLYD